MSIESRYTQAEIDEYGEINVFELEVFPVKEHLSDPFISMKIDCSKEVITTIRDSIRVVFAAKEVDIRIVVREIESYTSVKVVKELTDPVE